MPSCDSEKSEKTTKKKKKRTIRGPRKMSWESLCMRNTYKINPQNILWNFFLFFYFRKDCLFVFRDVVFVPSFLFRSVNVG